ncbi:MAG TPA: hypothetical protein VFH48_09990 [Chloroflexota bacterium]|nr:hypothetical protein [Chloroflexota bacterium]
MSVYSGKVVNGVVRVKGVLLPEGTKVTILVPEDEEPIDLSPDMIAELEESIAQIERGEYVTWEELREELRKTEREAQPR